MNRQRHKYLKLSVPFVIKIAFSIDDEILSGEGLLLVAEKERASV